MTLKVGSLFSGYGGLDLAADMVFGAEPAWFVEFDDAPSKILNRHWPGVPNYGDVTKVDWSALPPVDILTGGYPCQPFSAAGRRKGADDERHLWPYVREAIRVLRPRIVFLENVAGHRSLGFDQVLGDLAEDGADVWWTSLRASDIGAPHHRERLFILVVPADAGGATVGEHAGESLTEETGVESRHGPRDSGGKQPTGNRRDAALADGDSRGLEGGAERDGEPVEPELDTQDGDHPHRRAVHIADAEGERLPGQQRPGGSPAEGSGTDCSVGAFSDPVGTRRHERWGATSGETAGGRAHREPVGCGDGIPRWGKYAPAVERWEALTRPAPDPTEPNTKGNPRLKAAFAEWMMGLPAGWVTDTPGISRADQLKAIGNGVCPPQAAAALLQLLDLAAEPGGVSHS